MHKVKSNMPNKLGDPAGCHYLVTTLTFYYSTVTDLTLSRSVHATELEPCCPDPFLLSSSECRAIHYGQCSSLLKLPTFSIVPPNCSIDRKVQKPSVELKREENALRLPAEAANQISSSRSSSLDTDPCSSLDLLAANIEQNLKPFLNILSSCETTEWSDSGQDESIGSLATSLQYHLGNFIAAVRQQQISNDQSNEDQDAKSSAATESSDIRKKKVEFQTKGTSYKDRIYNHESSPVLKGGQTKHDWSSSISNAGTTQNYTNNLILERKDSQLDSRERNSERAVNKTSSRGLSDKKMSYLYSSEDSLAKQREVMRILNKNETVKNTLYNSTDTVDSELLDSLISLMNVSLVDLEDSPKKKNNHFQQGKTYLSSSKSVRSPETRTRIFASEDCNISSSDSKEPEKHGSNNQPLPPCRRKLNFGNDGTSENCIFSKVPNNVTGLSGKQSIENGELGVFPDENFSRVEWSIPSFHRRDSLALVQPSVTDTKRTHASPRQMQTSGTADNQQLVSVTKSSVAERVLAFEKCPDWSVERSSNLKEVYRKTAKEKDFLPPLAKKAKYSSRSALLENSVTQFVKKPSQIPKFYHPNGQLSSSENFEATIERIQNAFAVSKGKVTYETFHVATKACPVPLYWKMPLYLAVGTDKLNYITTNRFLEFWKRMANVYHDEPSRFVYILSKGQRTFLLPEDFRPMIQDIVDTHPGLTFLKDSKEFHSRYVDTVISRIFYDVNRSWSGKITALELRKSNFLQAVAELEDDDDINQMTDYFSYEHFYVIYCKFWKIDTDHDLLIDRRDLRHHNNGDISTRMIDRIFSGAVSREMLKTAHMRYTDFVWFLLAEEDKRHPRSIEYWFRCMDLNGDGFLSMYELEYFYDEQVRRMEASGIEVLPFKDCLCQMLDMVRPKIPEKISLSDLKHCKLTTLFFDTFFNLGKYLEHEHRDPFASAKVGDSQTPEISDWCRYAEEEYNRLISEENYGYSDRYQGSGQYYCAENAAFAKPEFASKVYSKSSERDDDDDYADSDADY